MGQTPAPQPDWFSANALKQQPTGDWFESNAPQQAQPTNQEPQSWWELHPVTRELVLGAFRGMGIPISEQPMTDLGRGLLQAASHPLDAAIGGAKNIGSNLYQMQQAALPTTNMSKEERANAMGAGLGTVAPFLAGSIGEATGVTASDLADAGRMAARGAGKVATTLGKPRVSSAIGTIAGLKAGGWEGAVAGRLLAPVVASQLRALGAKLTELGARAEEALPEGWNQAEEGRVEGTENVNDLASYTQATPGGKPQVPTTANTQGPQLAPKQDMSNTARTRRIVAGLPPEVPAKTAQTIASDPDLIPLLKQSIANRIKDLM